MNNDVTSNENQTQEQSEEVKTEEQPKATEEPTVTKQKLNAPVDDDSTDNKAENTKLNETLSENEKLKAQLVRRDQMDTVAQQFNKAGVIVPKDVLELVVPSGIDDKQVSKNMKALSLFYDSIVKETKQSFLKAETPRVTGSDNKPFDKSQLRKIQDPVKRVELIKKHIDDFR